jgi:lipopolysaccharide export system protein LptC
VYSVQSPALQAGMDARFAIAARHSRMVRVLRIAVPAIVALAMAGVIAISIFNPFRALMKQLPVDMENLVVSGTKITMESPHMSGFSPDQRPYEVWAKTATQDLTDPDRVELKTVRAKVLMEDRTTTVTMDARTGLFDTKAQLLDLRKDIFLQSSTGYEARLSQALVDIGKGNVSSEEHVDVKLLNGTLSADKLRITEKGEIVRFEGHVVMNLIMDNPEPAPAAAEPVNEPAPEPSPAQPAKARSSSAKRANAK